MNTQDAALQLARSMPGGVESLAVRLGKSAHTLRHELTGSGTAKLGLLDAESIGMFAQQVGHPNALAVVTSMAANLGAMVISLPSAATTCEDTFRGLADAAREFSDFVGSVAEASSDGVITANELRHIDRELTNLISRVQALRALMADKHEASKPRALREVGMPEREGVAG